MCSVSQVWAWALFSLMCQPPLLFWLQTKLVKGTCPCWVSSFTTNLPSPTSAGSWRGCVGTKNRDVNWISPGLAHPGPWDTSQQASGQEVPQNSMKWEAAKSISWFTGCSHPTPCATPTTPGLGAAWQHLQGTGYELGQASTRWGRTSAVATHSRCPICLPPPPSASPCPPQLCQGALQPCRCPTGASREGQCCDHCSCGTCLHQCASFGSLSSLTNSPGWKKTFMAEFQWWKWGD